MAIIAADNVAVQAQGFGSLTVIRQLGLMLGLAMSVALGVTVALWSQTPNYSMLYGNLSAKDLSQITSALDSSGIEYKLDASSAAILVPADKVQQARMRLAASGTKVSNYVGFEILDKSPGLGSNSFLLKARYQRALEGELAQTISMLKMIDSARVHLAIPKQSAFARKSTRPSATVVLNLYPGMNINDRQTASIVNIVASSIPGLETEQVTVTDDRGRLLSTKGNDSSMANSNTQFDYTRKLEDRYVKRILDIISPIVGLEGVRAQVVADINFTSLEETKESYLPEKKALRSEQLFEQNSSLPSVSGVPGALSNQAPAGGSVDAKTETTSTTVNNSSRALRNYEIDRTISHIRKSPVTLLRLSVAVIVDYRSVPGKKGKVIREPLTEQEIKYVTELVREAVGFNKERGDTLNVVNTQFQLPEQVEPLPESPLWEQAWVLDLAKQIVGGLVVLFIAFGVLRPMLSNLSKQGESSALALASAPANNAAEHLPAGEDHLTLTNQNPSNSQQLLDVASTMVKEDPKRVAQVMSTWVESDG
ncbi:MAG: flagellar M-ring protein FliF [Gammaproteobacteria bacterium]|nr:MAG: flagellar M-ring protein FliF [Gammaproteobacteria bacterium]